jgi:hypothetical protein
LLIYWALFAFFAAGAIFAHGTGTLVPAGGGGNAGRRVHVPFEYVFFLGVAATIMMIGFRFRVGADWFNYMGLFAGVQHYSLISAMRLGDPGYQLFNWLANYLGFQIWFVNLVAAIVFGWGLYRFCSVQPSPWLAYAIAVPYLVVVVAMGYTRQSMALGVLMAGLAKQTRGGSIFNFAIYVVLAASFHKTAIILFPIVAISARGDRVVNFTILLIASAFLYYYFLGDAMDGLVTNYLDRGYDSQGAGVRVAMNLVPAILMWVFRGRLGFEPDEYRVWRNCSLAALAFTFLLFVLSSSTAVDRMSLYLMPLQIAVLTRVALLGESRMSGVAAVIGYLFTVQFVWLNFADHARYWVPYQFYPF